MSILRTFNELTSSVNNNFQGRPYVSIYTLGERSGYPVASVLHDICQFTIQRPSGAPDNYRIYTPATNTYNLEIVSSNANDTLAGTGVQKVRVYYLDANWEMQSVDANLNGTKAVAVASNVRRVNDVFSIQTGSLSVAAGDITLRTTVGSTIEAPFTGVQTLGQISQGGNKDLTALFTVPEGKEVYINEISKSSANSDQSIRLRSNTDPISRTLLPANCFLFQNTSQIGSDSNSSKDLNYLKFPSRADIKISALPSATQAVSSADVTFEMIDKIV